MIQSNWQLCDHCDGLFFAGGTSLVCPGTSGVHASTSGNTYVLSDVELSLPVTATFVGTESDPGLSIVSPAGGNTGISVLSRGVSLADGTNPVGVDTETDGFGVALVAKAVDGPAVFAMSTTGRGVRGMSAGQGDGVAGFSGSGTGVFGEGPQHGVHGKSADGRAVFGENTAGGDGVGGVSQTGTGVAGISDSGHGIYGSSRSGMAGYFDGHIQVTGEIRMDGADFAEEFDVPPDVAPGTVMVIGGAGQLIISRDSYDKRVAGVIAGAGRFRPGMVLDTGGDIPDNGARQAISLMGKTYCMVDATVDPVAIGDLLTTSDKPGCAMRATDRERAFGSIIGKALAPLDVGQQLIPILVALQ